MTVTINLARPVVRGRLSSTLSRIASRINNGRGGRALRTAAFLTLIGGGGCSSADPYFDVSGQGDNWNEAARQFLVSKSRGCAVDNPSEAVIKSTADKLQLVNANADTPEKARSDLWGVTIIATRTACPTKAAQAMTVSLEVSPAEITQGETKTITVTGPEGFAFENPLVDTLGCKGLTVENIQPAGKLLEFDLTAIERGANRAQPGEVDLAIITGPENARDAFLEKVKVNEGAVKVAKRRERREGRPCKSSDVVVFAAGGKTPADYNCVRRNDRAVWTPKNQ